MSNVSSTTMSRRDFAKVAGGALVALAAGAVAYGATPGEALADTTCTANVSCDPDDALIEALIGSDSRGYMTNANTPLHGGFPTSPVSNNATYTYDGTTYTITIPLVNTMFELRSIPSTSDDGGMTAKATAYDGSRISELQVTCTVASGSFTFTGATEYAGYALIQKSESWPVRIDIAI